MIICNKIKMQIFETFSDEPLRKDGNSEMNPSLCCNLS